MVPSCYFEPHSLIFVVVNGLAWTAILYSIIEIAERSEDDAKSRSRAEG